MRDLLGPLVDQQHDDARLGGIGVDAARDLREQLGLAGLGRRDDQPPGAVADRSEELDQAHRGVAAVPQPEAPVRVHCGQVLERRPLAEGRGLQAADGLDVQQLRALLARGGGTDHQGAGGQPEAVDQPAGDEGVAGIGAEGADGVAQGSVAVLQDLQDAGAGFGHGFRSRGKRRSVGGVINGPIL